MDRGGPARLSRASYSWSLAELSKYTLVDQEEDTYDGEDVRLYLSWRYLRVILEEVSDRLREGLRQARLIPGHRVIGRCARHLGSRHDGRLPGSGKTQGRDRVADGVIKKSRKEAVMDELNEP